MSSTVRDINKLRFLNLSEIFMCPCFVPLKRSASVETERHLKRLYEIGNIVNLLDVRTYAAGRRINNVGKVVISLSP